MSGARRRDPVEELRSRKKAQAASKEPDKELTNAEKRRQRALNRIKHRASRDSARSEAHKGVQENVMR
ncbi:hypothetical protein GF380_04195, partial [Candidatus Uhrbacteria bacterium]|nr:hypothetical protein [Candidatus Uhrbacteria bacterium]MBD3284282.1 hypothetical protein [Candidatus Uhrbacteria bacterium]